MKILPLRRGSDVAMGRLVSRGGIHRCRQGRIQWLVRSGGPRKANPYDNAVAESFMKEPCRRARAGKTRKTTRALRGVGSSGGRQESPGGKPITSKQGPPPRPRHPSIVPTGVGRYPTRTRTGLMLHLLHCLPRERQGSRWSGPGIERDRIVRDHCEFASGNRSREAHDKEKSPDTLFHRLSDRRHPSRTPARNSIDLREARGR